MNKAGNVLRIALLVSECVNVNVYVLPSEISILTKTELFYPFWYWFACVKSFSNNKGRFNSLSSKYTLGILNTLISCNELTITV